MRLEEISDWAIASSFYESETPAPAEEGGGVIGRQGLLKKIIPNLELSSQLSNHSEMQFFNCLPLP